MRAHLRSAASPISAKDNYDAALQLDAKRATALFERSTGDASGAEDIAAKAIKPDIAAAFDQFGVQ